MLFKKLFFIIDFYSPLSQYSSENSKFTNSPITDDLYSQYQNSSFFHSLSPVTNFNESAAVFKTNFDEDDHFSYSYQTLPLSPNFSLLHRENDVFYQSNSQSMSNNSILSIGVPSTSGLEEEIIYQKPQQIIHQESFEAVIQSWRLKDNTINNQAKIKFEASSTELLVRIQKKSNSLQTLESPFYK